MESFLSLWSAVNFILLHFFVFVFCLGISVFSSHLIEKKKNNIFVCVYYYLHALFESVFTCICSVYVFVQLFLILFGN